MEPRNASPLALAVAVSVAALGLACRAITADGPSSTDGGAPDAPVVHDAALAGAVVATLAGADVSGSQDGSGSAARFDDPTGLFLESSGALLVAEHHGGRIRRVTATGETTLVAGGFQGLEPFAVVGTADGLYVVTDRNADRVTGDVTATFWHVPAGGNPEVVKTGLGVSRGLLLLANGKIVVPDSAHHRLALFDPADKSFTPIAGSGKPGLVDGKGALASFNRPCGAALLPDGSFVVADQQNHALRRVTVTGEVSLFAGDGTAGLRDDGDRLNARFNAPTDVAADVVGTVYVSDAGNHRIRRITPLGAVESLAGNGKRGFADGDVKAAEFYGQEGIELSADGKTLFISDGNAGGTAPFNRVRRVALP